MGGIELVAGLVIDQLRREITSYCDLADRVIDQTRRRVLLGEQVPRLVSKGIDRALLYQQALVTPSCGLATETVERADQTMDALVDLSCLVREREGFA